MCAAFLTISWTFAFLALAPLEALQEEACLALVGLAHGHRENQESIFSAGAVGPLVRILHSRRMPAKVKAARALEAIADHNVAIQTQFLKTSATKHLLRLLKVIFILY